MQNEVTKVQGIQEIVKKIQAQIQEQIILLKSTGSEQQEKILKEIQLTQTTCRSKCKKCDDFGYIIDGWTAIPCDCLKELKTQKLLNSSEITDDFKKLSFTNFVTEGKDSVIADMKAMAIKYYQDFPDIRKARHNSILLSGQPGSGKTHLLVALSNNLIQRKNVETLYFPYVEGFGNLRDDFSLLERKLEKMKNVEVLFIDDLFKPSAGKPQATDWQIGQMYNVINHRYLNHLPIMISTELDLRGLIGIDEALGSRILEMAKGYTTVIPRDIKLNHRLGFV